MLLPCHIVQAIQAMRAQKKGGIILNMDVECASGTATPLFAADGATKRGLAQLGKSLRVQRRFLLSSSTAFCIDHRQFSVGKLQE